MPVLKIDITDLQSQPQAANALLAFAGEDRVLLFDAPMGSGKTTFIKSLCRSLGVTDAVSSPTYSIVNEYIAADGRPIFHFDLYRLKGTSELYDLGFEEYLSRDALVLVEWPEMAMPFFNNFVKIAIRLENNKRYIYAEKFSDHA